MMKRRSIIVLGLMFGILALGAAAFAQFLPEELAERAKWEEFLKTAEIIASEQMTSGAVTNPWVLTLKQGDVTKRALWKDITGRPKGYIDSWMYEVAGYELDKLLGLNMVPPTAERRFKENRGSIQLWVDDTKSLRKLNEEKIKPPSYKVFYYNRSLFLQRAFDNLIGNEDRHQDNYLIVMKDWRMILIDHSRSFRSSGKFIKQLTYTEKHPEGPMVMKELPKAFFEKIKGLTVEQIKEAVGEYLSDDEIKAVLIRKDLIVKEIDKLVAKNGAENVLYEK
ncbi:MAG: hypothetical protein Q8O91_08990 [Candidatus Aminicenantes bacterium]|nr:hypothetical protein [Candidatus Aminicenantes bacterium]